jgi:inorganic pyrophosphatase
MPRDFIPYKAHPWHGVQIGDRAPQVVNAYIEIVPSDGVKYEIDKASGHLKVDRPQKYSSQCPSLYGFIPQTLCDTKVGEFCSRATGREGIIGDGDPLDVCVLSEKQFAHGDFLLSAVPIGGLRLIDGDQADDKIIAVLEIDGLYGAWREIGDCPTPVLERLKHYFLTYKDVPGSSSQRVEIASVFSAEEAREIIRLSEADYRATFGTSL